MKGMNQLEWRGNSSVCPQYEIERLGMSEAKYYCHLDSGGSIDSTNLQLYSLKKAYEEWESLSEAYNQSGENTGFLKERLVYLVATLGLSLSQLLGQNPVILKQKVDRPHVLLAAFLRGSKYDKPKQELLKRKFKDFIKYYDACRHFGRDSGRKKWGKMDSLNFDKVKTFIQTTLDIWNAVIGHHRTGYMDAEDIKDILRGML